MALTAAAVPSAAADAKGVELYVSPSGDDSAEGTVSAPLRTLEGARNAVRKLREGGGLDGGITVYLREGVLSAADVRVYLGRQRKRGLPHHICFI